MILGETILLTAKLSSVRILENVSLRKFHFLVSSILTGCLCFLLLNIFQSKAQSKNCQPQDRSSETPAHSGHQEAPVAMMGLATAQTCLSLLREGLHSSLLLILPRAKASEHLCWPALRRGTLVLCWFSPYLGLRLLL